MSIFGSSVRLWRGRRGGFADYVLRAIGLGLDLGLEKRAGMRFDAQLTEAASVRYRAACLLVVW